jgi:hypothetical protein
MHLTKLFSLALLLCVFVILVILSLIIPGENPACDDASEACRR